MALGTIINRIKRKWTKLRLQPIHIYCLHHVCNSFDAEYMHKCDYLDILTFKEKIIDLQHNGIKFVSLSDAYNMISKDIVRIKKYAVLSFDDGYASFKEILPWLKEHSIPVTLFVNPDYVDGMSYRETQKERYLSRQELNNFDVEIGMHGTKHFDVSKMSEKVFSDFMEDSITKTYTFNNYIPFWAYTWGRHNNVTDKILKENGIVPVLMDGLKNYNGASCIHREEFPIQ